jgi:AsmA-like C-terminal region
MRTFLKWLGISAAVIAVLAILALTVFASRLKLAAKARVQEYLGQHFESDVQFTDFDVSLYPLPGATIDGLALYHHGHRDLPPLIKIRRVILHTGVLGLFEEHIHIRSVDLEGLVITMPPKASGARPDLHATNVDLAKKYPVMIDRIEADNALISIQRADTSKPPRDFPIQHLHIQKFSFDGPADFQAQLTNAVPTGEIDAAGQFGPWDPDAPRQLPVNARYTFKNADMGTLRGLSGTMQSNGAFSGPLDYLSVKGATEIPNFALRVAGHPVDLHTDFTATVDGTNGNVLLHPVIAHFRHTTFVVNGEVVDLNKSAKGRTIQMDVNAKQARIEDLLYLTVKNDPPLMTGDAHFLGKMEIREGDEDLLDKLTVNGTFDVAESHFTSQSVQEKIDSLSRRGQGHPEDHQIDDVVSDLKGNFNLANGVINFSSLNFSVTGAAVALQGTYGMENGNLDFHGHLLMQAKLSQTMTGAKSVLLKAADPFFRGKNGGSSVPIKITGTREHPEYGLDLGGKKK